tara:strand:+ start:1067 stop:2110 length:1044 start_codon:yes stop_codon:yes gene_type:complete
MDKNILAPNIQAKATKYDPELILENELLKKYGERYKKYRKDYFTMLEDDKHKNFFNYPLTVVLELINRCNLECVMCYQGYRNDAKQHTIEDKMLDKIFDDFKENKLSALMLSASEPLLYKGIEKVLHRAKDAEIMDVFLFTNGSLLTKERSQMILDSSVTRLFVSIDAATQESYDKVRVPVSKRLLKEDRLEDLDNNIKQFINMRNSLNRKTPVVRVSFCSLKENVHEIELFKKKWVDIVDSVEIQKEQSIEVYEKLEKINDTEVKKRKLKTYNCNKPWGDMSIYSDGSVGPCCNLVGRKAPIGNVNNNTIKEIWNGEKMNRIRDGFRNNNPIDVCKVCLESVVINN